MNSAEVSKFGELPRKKHANLHQSISETVSLAGRPQAAVVRSCSGLTNLRYRNERLSHDKKIPPLAERIEEGAPEHSPDDLLVQVNLRLKLDEIAEVEAVALRAQAPRLPTDGELRRLAKRIYDARRTRDKVLDRNLFGEPAWDMLLALSYMPAQGKFLSVSGLSHVSGVPETTALRWQEVLTREGLIERGPDELEFIRLTERGRSLMDGYLSRLWAEAPVAPLNDLGR